MKIDSKAKNISMFILIILLLFFAISGGLIPSKTIVYLFLWIAVPFGLVLLLAFILSHVKAKKGTRLYNSRKLIEEYRNGKRVFQSIELTGGELEGIVLDGADFSGSYFYRVNLDNAYLHDVGFRQADIEGASLKRASLSGADFTDAKLASDLEGADFTRAKLVRTDLSGSKLANAKLDGAYIQEVIYNQYTEWPEGFDLSGIDATMVS